MDLVELEDAACDALGMIANAFHLGADLEGREREAQVPGARIGISSSIGGPGNNNYVTILEASASRRRREPVAQPRRHYESRRRRPERDGARALHGARATVEGATTIHVTAGGGGPVHVALLSIDGRRVFAKLENAPEEGQAFEQVIAGQQVNLLVKDDGDQYFQIPRSSGFDVGRLVQAIRRRVGVS